MTALTTHWPHKVRSYIFLMLVLTAAIAAVPCLVACTAESRDPQNLDTTKRIVSAAGGAEALQAVKAIRAEGDITAIMRRDSGSYERVWARGRRLWVKTIYSRSSELRLLHGKRGWRGRDERSLSEADGPRFNAMLYQYLVLDLPFGLADGRYTVRIAGKDQHAGQEVDVLRLMVEEAPEIYVFVDREGRIVKSRAIFTVGTSESPVLTSLSAEFNDFRRVDGLLLPHAVTYFARDMRIARMTIDRYILNPALDEVAFEPVR